MKDFSNSSRHFKPNQTVWIRNVEDILATLDSHDKLDGLPFIPEMIKFCGKSFRISRIANRTCVEGYGLRNMTGTVFLEDLRCDGANHDGCQRECLLFWKEDWLSSQPIIKNSQQTAKISQDPYNQLTTKTGNRYYCQSTELKCATSELPRGRFFKFIIDVLRGEMSVKNFFKLLIQAILNKLNFLIGADFIRQLRDNKMKTDSVDINLKRGEWVEVKNRKEIEKTLNHEGKNKGLLFDPVMLKFCEKRYKVAKNLDKIILEESGQIKRIKNTVVLENVKCQTLGCPRANLLFWREIWLKRIN